MFMVFNAIFLVVTALGTGGALVADQARDERAAASCSARAEVGSAAYTDCLRKFGVTTETQFANRPR